MLAFASGSGDCLVLWGVITLGGFREGTALVRSMSVRYCGWLLSWSGVSALSAAVSWWREEMSSFE